MQRRKRPAQKEISSLETPCVELVVQNTPRYLFSIILLLSIFVNTLERIEFDGQNRLFWTSERTAEKWGIFLDRYSKSLYIR